MAEQTSEQLVAAAMRAAVGRVLGGDAGAVPPDYEVAQRRLAEIQEQMTGLLDALLACEAHSRDTRPAAPKLAGVYLFTGAGVHRYVGRTRNFNRRFGEHVAPKSRQNKAAFAFNIAKSAAAADGFDISGSRESVEARPGFEPYFRAAKSRVRQMDFRFVEINDPAVSTIFEVYASVALHTEGEYNLFETH
jgi:hypothetical protein